MVEWGKFLEQISLGIGKKRSRTCCSSEGDEDVVCVVASMGGHFGAVESDDDINLAL